MLKVNQTNLIILSVLLNKDGSIFNKRNYAHNKAEQKLVSTYLGFCNAAFIPAVGCAFLAVFLPKRVLFASKSNMFLVRCI